MHGSDTYNRPSRFIAELPTELLQQIRIKSSLWYPKKKSVSPSGGSIRPLIDEAAIGLRMGQRVRHAKFGEGVVTQAEGSGERARVQIRFSNVGSKWLMLGIAKIEPLE